jgi:hypothetical protein
VFVVALARGGLSPFSDDPLTPGLSTVKAIHIAELRARIDALRVQFGLAAFAWTDLPLGPGVFIRQVHISEMRNALQQAYAAAGRPTGPGYTDATLVPGSTPIRVVHIQELRDAVIVLETS